MRRFVLSLLCVALLSLLYGVYAMIPARSLGSGKHVRLLVSQSPDRSKATSLRGQSLASPLYVFVSSDPAIREVTFSVDGHSSSTERSSPFDLSGTAADGGALPWSPAAGAHTIAAAVQLKATTRTLAGTLVVDSTTTTTTTTTTTATTATTAPPTTATTAPPTTTPTAPPTTTPTDQPACTGVRLSPGSDIQAALNANSTGSSFCLGAGTHRLRAPLTPRRGQKISGEAGAILSGAKLVTGWTYDSGNRWWYHAGGTSRPTALSGQCADGTDLCKYPDDVWRDNLRLRRAPSLAGLGSGGVYVDYGADRLYLKDDPTNAVVELSATPQAFVSGGNNSGTPDAVLSEFAVEKFANPAQQPAVQMGPGWLIDGLDVRRNHGVGIESGSGSVLRNSHIWAQGQLGLSGGGSVGALVENNEINDNNTAGYSPGWEGGGSKWAFTRSLTVRGNYVHDNRGAGLWTDGDNLYCTFENNKVENNAGPGIQHELGYDAVIRNNSLRNNALATAGKSIWWGADVVLNDSQNVQLYGNRIVSSVNGISLIDTDRGSGRYGVYKVANTDVHDNTLTMAAGTQTGLVGRSTAFQSTAGNHFQGNTYYLPTLDGLFWQWQASLSKDGWQRLGQDTTATFLRQ